MHDQPQTLRVPAADMLAAFARILRKHGFTNDRAAACAQLFTDNSVDGVYTHGVNRFPRFVKYVQEGFVRPDATPVRKGGFGGLEQWDGRLGPGPLNAVDATDRAMQLAAGHGIGCVALANTNHWMRGGAYGWQAAKAGFVFIGWTNTIANMPAWGARDSRLGNNPLIFALPYQGEAIVLDAAMSQYSFGAMEMAQLKGQQLSTWGGYDKNGRLTTDPAAVLETRRPLPIGYWKGAGMALLLDLLATILSGGLSTMEISTKAVEYGLSQVFIAIDLSKLDNRAAIPAALETIVNDYRQSVPEGDNRITYPGERVLQTRRDNLANGIPVLSRVWGEIEAL